MKTNHPMTRIEIDAAVRAAKEKIDAFVARAINDGPTAAIESLAASAIEAETTLRLLSMDKDAESIIERATELLTADDYVFGFPFSKDAERAAARKVKEICIDAELRE